MKLNKKWIIGIIVVLLVLGPGKDLLARLAIQGGMRLMTGLQLGIQKFNLGLIGTTVNIEGLQLHNPKGFEDKLMVDIPKILVDYEITPLFTGKIHAKEIVFHLKEFSVIKNKDGVVNIDSLKVVQQQKEEKRTAEKPKEEKPEKKAEPLKIQIDSLHLIIEKTYFKDYTKGDQPSVKEFPINIDEKFENITSYQKLISLIMYKALMGTTIGRFVDVDMDALKGTASEALATGKEYAAAAGEKAKEAAAQAQEKVGESMEDVKAKTAESFEESKQAASETAEKAGEKVSEAAGAAKEKASALLKKLPFGKK